MEAAIILELLCTFSWIHACLGSLCESFNSLTRIKHFPFPLYLINVLLTIVIYRSFLFQRKQHYRKPRGVNTRVRTGCGFTAFTRLFQETRAPSSVS